MVKAASYSAMCTYSVIHVHVAHGFKPTHFTITVYMQLYTCINIALRGCTGTYTTVYEG